MKQETSLNLELCETSMGLTPTRFQTLKNTLGDAQKHSFMMLIAKNCIVVVEPLLFFLIPNKKKGLQVGLVVRCHYTQMPNSGAWVRISHDVC